MMYYVLTFRIKTPVFNVNGFGENVHLCLFHAYNINAIDI